MKKAVHSEVYGNTVHSLATEATSLIIPWTFKRKFKIPQFNENLKNKEVKGMFLNVNMGVFYQITEVFRNSCMKRVPHTLLWQFFSYALIVGDFPFLLERLSWRTWFIKREARIRLFFPPS